MLRSHAVLREITPTQKAHLVFLKHTSAQYILIETWLRTDVRSLTPRLWRSMEKCEMLQGLLGSLLFAMKKASLTRILNGSTHVWLELNEGTSLYCNNEPLICTAYSAPLWMTFL